MQCAIDKTRVERIDYVDGMAAYLLKHHVEDLRQILQDPNPSTSKHHAVEVSFLDIAEYNMIMATLFAHYPMEVQLHFDDAVVEAQNRLLESMGPEERQFDELRTKQSCHLRVHSLPRCPELWKPTVTDIRAEDVHRLLTVSGTVIRTGIMKLIHQRREYKCPKCEHRFFVESDFEQRNEMKMPLECPSAGLSARPCNATRFDVCLLYTSPSPRDRQKSRMPSSA